MPEFSEDLLQFIWRHRLLKPLSLKGSRGERIVVKHPGQLNRDSGPDFSGAMIEIDGVLLNGNVEMHLRSSDWLRHGHQADPAYDRIVLHAVYEHDTVIGQNAEHGVTVLELKHYIDPAVIGNYRELSARKGDLPCAASINEVPEPLFSIWLERMVTERLEQRLGRLAQWLHTSKGNYMEVLYVSLLSGFGFKVNALPFELLARTLPIQILLRHAGHLTQVEALLFGCAGLLDEQFRDQHLRNLQNEFEFLRRKYKLRSMASGLLKFSRLRPANFPTLRLAQFASVVHHHPGLISDILSFSSKGEIVQALRTPLSDYWQHHCMADGTPTDKNLGLGVQSAENLVINCFAPFYFFYGKKFAKENYCELAMDLLSQCAPEDNRTTRFFHAKQHLLTSAAQSQGAIQLFDHYCENKRCLECAVGHSVISGATKEALQL